MNNVWHPLVVEDIYWCKLKSNGIKIQYLVGLEDERRQGHITHSLLHLHNIHSNRPWACSTLYQKGKKRFLALAARGKDVKWLRNLLTIPLLPIWLYQCHQFLNIMVVKLQYQWVQSKMYNCKSKHIRPRHHYVIGLLNYGVMYHNCLWSSSKYFFFLEKLCGKLLRNVFKSHN